jgi:hypothetical protein
MAKLRSAAEELKALFKDTTLEDLMADNPGLSRKAAEAFLKFVMNTSEEDIDYVIERTRLPDGTIHTYYDIRKPHPDLQKVFSKQKQKKEV